MRHVWINRDHDRLDVTLHGATPASQDVARDKAQRVAVKAHGSQAPPADEAIHTTTNHPWLTADREWVQAGDLRLGERVMRLDGTTATVVALAVRPGVADYYNLTVSQVHTYAVGVGQFVVHNCGGKTSEDLYAFGSKSGGPPGARPGTAIEVDGGTVRALRPPNPHGVSTFRDPAEAPLSGHYHRLPAGTDLPDGSGVCEDGAEIGGSQPAGHRTIYPTRDMSFNEFDMLIRGLPWEYAGRK